jgi:hypothetical protein
MRLATKSVLFALALVSAACEGPDKTPATLTKQSDLAAGAAVASSNNVSLVVANKKGEPLAGVEVTFAVTAGGGSITPATDTTDDAGVASATVTLGTTVGDNTVTGTVTGLSPVTFTTTTVAGPAVSITLPAKITALSVDASSTLTPAAKDQYGNTAILPAVTYTSRTTSAATVSAAGAVTGVAAGQSMIVAATSAGSDSTLAVVAPAGGPVLVTDLASFSLGASSDQVISVIMDMRDGTEKLGSTVAKLEWDPTVVSYQSHSAATGGPTATVNSNNASSGSLLLSVADANGYAGKVTLLKIVFKAGTAGKSGTLKLSTTEVTAAQSFVSLLSKTVAASMPVAIR